MRPRRIRPALDARRWPEAGKSSALFFDWRRSQNYLSKTAETRPYDEQQSIWPPSIAQAEMKEAPHISYYRRKAAELRAYADKTNNVTLKLEFLKIAASFDELADLATKYPVQRAAS